MCVYIYILHNPLDPSVGQPNRFNRLKSWIRLFRQFQNERFCGMSLRSARGIPRKLGWSPEEVAPPEAAGQLLIPRKKINTESLKTAILLTPGGPGFDSWWLMDYQCDSWKITRIFQWIWSDIFGHAVMIHLCLSITFTHLWFIS